LFDLENQVEKQDANPTQWRSGFFGEIGKGTGE
jgi:hypothetical protein